ncbi:MAG: hypothetical protein JNM89_01520 [Hyphomicrobiaceae bacterium]|nr:hypothetical protein [Hyphomicrobiaceae bacterium]
MLGIPQLARFTFPYQDGDKRHPTLIIKAHSLLLKYIAQGVLLEVSFFTTSDGHPAFALYIDDEPQKGVFLWSLLNHGDEVAAIRHISQCGECSIYLFNEACANCAWTSASIEIDASILAMLDAMPMSKATPAVYADEIAKILDQLRDGTVRGVVRSIVLPKAKWKPLKSSFILNGALHTNLNLLADNEGTHQEQLAHTLLGDLSPQGAYVNPQLHEPSGKKEFTDVLLSHEFGTVLLESKSLSIFEQRTNLPDRSRLSRNIEKSAKRGVSQLLIASRKLREYVPIFDQNGSALELERAQPPHAIILVPDLSLLTPKNDDWLRCIVDFMKKTKGFLHLLDTVQLFRVMQAAQMIATNSNTTTPMMAFDFYLIERAKTVIKRGSIDVDMILRLQK